MSLARAHRDRVLAALAAGKALDAANENAPPAHSGAAANAYAMHMAALSADRARLRTVQSIERKIALKRELLPQYAAWVEGVLEGAAETGKATEDEVVVTVMIWRIDVADLDGALPLARHVMSYNLPLPERFERKPATLIAEQFADTALEEIRADRGVSLEALGGVLDLLADRDMPDEVRARLHKAIGLELCRRAGDPQFDSSTTTGGVRGAQAAALTHLRRALELHDRCGVKAEINKLEKALAPPKES